MNHALQIRFILAAVAIIAMTTGGHVVIAQVFGPGELSNNHSRWDSLAHCDKCHSTGKKIDRDKCLSCHLPLQNRIRQHKGFHGQKRVRTATCQSCHPEHRGKDTPLIHWQQTEKIKSGTFNRDQFNHAQTGWPLRGAHGKAKCKSCHQPRLIRDDSVLKYIRTHPKATPFQGLSTRCVDCHFDEHRGQLKTKCDKCHNETAFKPVPKFKHNSYWKLIGAHQKTDCAKCHPTHQDTTYSSKQFPKPRSATYLQMNSIPHEKCIDCHKDPHQKRFGENCLSCHNSDNWLMERPPRDISFHDHTEFPLLGRHRFVPCEHCHPRNKHGKMKQTPIPHKRCNTCHPNAHPDFSVGNHLKRDCRDCHDNYGYSPSRFTVDDHQKLHFPLSAPHQAVACPQCHTQKMGNPIVSKIAHRVSGFTALKVVSPWRMKSTIHKNNCDACHDSPHRNQFAKQQCTHCHRKDTWEIDAGNWKHNEHSKYEMSGRHQKVPCADCHKTESDLSGSFVRYRPISHTDCIPCHDDQHLGQFRLLPPQKKCRECHTETGFTPSLFDHNNLKMSAFPLNGKHQKVRCIQCHPRSQLSEVAYAKRYRPTVTDCDLCHKDQHNGAFRKTTTKHDPLKKRFRDTVEKQSEEGMWHAPANWFPSPEKRTDCRSCHQEEGWQNVQFNHNNTRFPLKGRHLQTACEKCHTKDIKKVISSDCVGCHEDVHQGSLGANCKECHNENGFRQTSPNMFAKHNRTQFPLIGRHAALPCVECHRDTNSREFNKVPKECIACHADDIPSAGEAAIDHSAINMACDRCHTSVGWETAAFEGHDRCFPIGTFSKHGTVSCKKCHQGNPPTQLTDCSTGRFSCIQCHGCETSRHRHVSGYSCEDERCYQCHRNP